MYQVRPWATEPVSQDLKSMAFSAQLNEIFSTSTQRGQELNPASPACMAQAQSLLLSLNPVLPQAPKSLLSNLLNRASILSNLCSLGMVKDWKPGSSWGPVVFHMMSFHLRAFIWRLKPASSAECYLRAAPRPPKYSKPTSIELDY